MEVSTEKSSSFCGLQRHLQGEKQAPQDAFTGAHTTLQSVHLLQLLQHATELFLSDTTRQDLKHEYTVCRWNHKSRQIDAGP